MRTWVSLFPVELIVVVDIVYRASVDASFINFFPTCDSVKTSDADAISTYARTRRERELEYANITSIGPSLRTSPFPFLTRDPPPGPASRPEPTLLTT